MKFIIFNLADGSQKPCDLANLSRSLSPNCEIVRIIGNKHEAIGYVFHSLLVHFAVEFADYALQNYLKKMLPEAQTCIDLTRKWLQNHNSVSVDQLKEAADAAYNAAYAASAAYAAAYATHAAYAAAHAASAASAASAAADAAAYAAYASAAANADKNRLNEQNRQGTFILKFFEVE